MTIHDPFSWTEPYCEGWFSKLLWLALWWQPSPVRTKWSPFSQNYKCLSPSNVCSPISEQKVTNVRFQEATISTNPFKNVFRNVNAVFKKSSKPCFPRSLSAFSRISFARMKTGIQRLVDLNRSACFVPNVFSIFQGNWYFSIRKSSATSGVQTLLR